MIGNSECPRIRCPGIAREVEGGRAVDMFSLRVVSVAVCSPAVAFVPPARHDISLLFFQTNRCVVDCHDTPTEYIPVVYEPFDRVFMSRVSSNIDFIVPAKLLAAGRPSPK